MCRSIAPGKFVTFCYAIVDLHARTLSYSNAGHFPPILLRANGEVDRLTTSGMVLGIAPDGTYGTGTLELAAGDRLVLFTDGITEAMSPTVEEFGDERLINIVRAHRREPPDRLAEIVTSAVAQWTGGAPQDDATLIVMAVD
jgi:sigma-B regulation protein RsbU (phosphoserine phosphatase)